MATRTIVRPLPRLLSTRTCHPKIQTPSHRNPWQRIPEPVAYTPTSPIVRQTRFRSTDAREATQYDFAKVKQMAEKPDPEHVIIDVREPSEYASGYIPSALNIPVQSQPDALTLPNEEFEDRFGFPKPDPQKEVVFYCKAGVRSTMAAKLAGQAGYERLAEYRGSWLDWEANGGRVER